MIYVIPMPYFREDENRNTTQGIRLCSVVAAYNFTAQINLNSQLIILFLIPSPPNPQAYSQHSNPNSGYIIPTQHPTPPSNGIDI